MSQKQTSKKEKEEALRKGREEASLNRGGRGGGGGAARGAIHIDKDSGKILARILSYYGKKNIIRLILVLGCVVVTALLHVKTSMFIGTVIDDCIKPMLLMDVVDYTLLKNQIRYMAIIYGINIVVMLAERMMKVELSNSVLLDMRQTLFNHVQTLPINYFDTNKYGDIMSRFTNDIDNIRMLVSNSITEVFNSLITIVSVLFAMFKLSWQLTLVVLACVTIIYFVSIFIGGASSRAFTERQRTLGIVNAYIEEGLSGQKVVQVFCHEEKSCEEFDAHNENLRRTAVKANTLSSLVMPINGSLGNIQYVLIAVLGGMMAMKGNGALTLGMLASFLTLSRNFSRPVTSISEQVNSMVMALAGARRIFGIIDTPSEVDEGDVTLVKAKLQADGSLAESEDGKGMWTWKIPQEGKSCKYAMLQGAVIFSNVDFGYVPEKQILYDISIFAKPGQKIAFVGSTGAGKTTITNLINRFYDINEGSILFDGIDVRNIKKADLRHALGIVLQDTNLFTGTIAENIRYGKLDATMDEVKAAAKLANADKFIEKLPQGYDTVISGTGSQLSQGQCQLLAIARCAIAKPPVMILDEATSSIDTRTETLIQRGMDALMRGKTTFVIAHRLSTVQNANAIMVVEGGHIIERGDHDALIAQKGRYYTLYTGKSD